MISNSTSGLTVLPPERDVTVVDEEHHQDALVRWAPSGSGSSSVVAELRPAPVSRGTYAGRPGVAVLIDGEGVGELTFRMAQRYGPVVEQLVRRGQRPGAHAAVKHGRRGLVEVELKLPTVGAAPLPPPPVPDLPAGRRDAGPAASGTGKRSALWISGVVGAVLVVAGVVAGHDSGDRMTSTPSVTGVGASTAPGAPAPVATPAPGTPAAATSVAETPVPASPVPAVVDPPTPSRAEPAPPAEPVVVVPEPAVEPAPDPEPAPAAASYKNCTEAREAGVTPIHRGQPGYASKLDRDNDGIACE